jgi:type IV pilus assembly protein PilM
MASPKKILVLDLGMQSLRLAEFSANSAGKLKLLRGARREFLIDPALDASRPDQIRLALQEIVKEWKPSTKEVVCVLPAHTVFTRAVPIDVPGGISGKVDTIVRFEAHQNIPFPLEEVVWDYVVMGETATGAVNVVFLAVKTDILESICKVISSVGFKVISVTVAPMALYDAFRETSLAQGESPTVLLDIGSRTTNLVIVAHDSFFSRSIPSGGLAVTAAISKDIHAELEEAEHLKVTRGSVGLGPGYEPPADPVEANLARIARQALLKTQADISRSLGYYRTTLGGNDPSSILLTGGSASIPYLSEFIHEKLLKETGFFNPLEEIEISPGAAPFVESHPNNMGELVGGALELLPKRRTVISLLPPSVSKREHLVKRLPYLVTAAVVFIATLVAWYLYAVNVTKLTIQKTEEVTQRYRQESVVSEKILELQKRQEAIQKTGKDLLSVVLLRDAYPKILKELALKVPDRFLWITEVQPASDTPPKGTQTKANDTFVKAVIVKGLYLDNPRQASVIDDFITSLQSSEVFLVEEKEKSKIITQRGSPNNDYWAYPFALKIPLRTPIQPLP